MQQRTSCLLMSITYTVLVAGWYTDMILIVIVEAYQKLRLGSEGGGIFHNLNLPQKYYHARQTVCFDLRLISFYNNRNQFFKIFIK